MNRRVSATIWPLITPLKHPIRTSFGTMWNRPVLLLQLVDENGVEGWGESWVNFPSWALDERVVVLWRLLKDTLEFIARPGAVKEIIEHYRIQAVQSGNLGSFYHAVSALEIALWDLEAQRHHKPLRNLLHSGEDGLSPVPIYASGIGPDRIQERIEKAIDDGFKTIKFKVGFDRAHDHENFRLARSIPGVRSIIVDANQGWSREAALKEVPYYCKQGVQWVEEPISALDFEGYRLLGQQFSCIAAGENWYLDQISCAPTMQLKVLQPDLCKIGGIEAARTVIDFPATISDYVAFHVLGGPVAQAVSLQVASAWSERVKWVECDTNENLVRDVVQPSWTIIDGAAHLNSLPGLGLKIHADQLEEFVSTHLQFYHLPLAVDGARS